jgi:hypothetical protein
MTKLWRLGKKNDASTSSKSRLARIWMACPRPPKKPIHPTEVVFGEDNKKWRDEKLCEEPRSSVFGKRGRQFDIRGEVYVQKDVIELSMAKG